MFEGRFGELLYQCEIDRRRAVLSDPAVLYGRDVAAARAAQARAAGQPSHGTRVRQVLARTLAATAGAVVAALATMAPDPARPLPPVGDGPAD